MQIRTGALKNIRQAKEFGLVAQELYIISTDDDISSILDYQPEVANDNVFYVLPRVGTISPWSSKASDIASICGFNVRIERGTRYSYGGDLNTSLHDKVHDRMTEQAFTEIPENYFDERPQKSLQFVSLEGVKNELDSKKIKLSGSEVLQEAIQKANIEWGLALAPDEIEYLTAAYTTMERIPTDVELMMFGQVNSEHCRHKIFGATWTIDSKEFDQSLFSMIRNTFKCNSKEILSAYSDNAAVLSGYESSRLMCFEGEYKYVKEPIHTLIKVETHNHPTAVSPFPGAATGSGGEIRDEGAVGKGSKTKAGLTGFSVSNLNIPGKIMPWEKDIGYPGHIASSFEIMIEAPLGGCAFNNEFGRPGISGYFRTYLEEFQNEYRGYHKPIMIAGGMGTVRERDVHKGKIQDGNLLIVLGGVGMLIGLGGGAASSLTAGSSNVELDFQSVQRENPEQERRAQMVIDTCTSMDENIIIAIHDVGAGGLSNALPELVNDSDLGARFDLKNIPIGDKSMSPMEIWCNESQERFVLAIDKRNFAQFQAICERERCPFGVVGTATSERRLILEDSREGSICIDLPMDVLFGKPPKMHRVDNHVQVKTLPVIIPEQETIKSVTERVLRLPCVASKQFLITIGDRSVTGLVARDQMVGPWQVPVADVGVILTSNDHTEYSGQAMAMGERGPLALLSHAASARMSVAEALTNLVAAGVDDLSLVRLSANWMCCASHAGEGAGIYDAVKAIGLDLCPALGVTIPVGKDSMSMKSKWENKEVTSPMSVIITAYGNVKDCRKILTPRLLPLSDSLLVFIDLANKKQRLGATCLAQVYNQVGDKGADVEDVQILKNFWEFMSKGREFMLAYHDRSDGGLMTTIVEMCFAGRVGVNIDISDITFGSSREDALSALFNEELGCVLQIKENDLAMLKKIAENCGIESINVLGKVTEDSKISISHNGTIILDATRAGLQGIWQETSYEMQSRRDNPVTSKQEYESIFDESDPGLKASLTFDPDEDICAKFLNVESKPRVAILREQGVNSYMELASGFIRAGFTAVDVHMTDILNGRVSLESFVGLACPGGFSYGDVLGAGTGWAKSILLHENAKQEFRKFFERESTFTIGICNGCQMVSQLAEAGLIPGAEHWPNFKRNLSEQFEARVALLEVGEVNSMWFDGMIGSKIPVAVAHGEGRAVFRSKQDAEASQSDIALRYVKNNGNVADVENYPFNPNGSEFSVAGLTSKDGRVLILMPHPERYLRGVNNTWGSAVDGAGFGDDSGWMRLFRNARKWVG